MNMKKLLVKCYSALIRDKQKRRAVRDVLLHDLHDSDEGFTLFGGLLDRGNIDWPTYILTHNIPEKVAALRRGLNEESNELLDLVFSRMTIFPKGHHKQYANYKVRKAYLRSSLTPKELEDERVYREELPQYHTDFPMDGEDYNFDIFFYHGGLRSKNKKLKEYIAGTDFIDGGAYVGDSALLYIKRYAPRCVYSFEISQATIARYRNTMSMNDISADRYTICHLGLFDKKTKIFMEDSGSQGTSIFDAGGSSVQLTDLDSFALDNNLNVGFIKCDLEGVGLEALHGMAETIKRDRPVLNIAVYHNPREFFEIKPALDEITSELDYKITFERHYPLNDRMYDIVVFAYPKELDHE